nr:sigma-70 family RNA polymerase sigma factor [Lentihominibacter hominis]
MDREEILELLCSKYVYVIRLMKIMGVDENDVEDVATEVFIDAFRGLDNLRDPEKLVPWLKKIARNRASKYFRKRAKRKEISNMIKTEMGEIDIFDTIADEVTVEKLLQDAERRGMVRDMINNRIPFHKRLPYERRGMVRDMINNLPDVSRRVIRMRFWGEYKHSEIAEIMNININTEKSIYRRSLKHLKEQYLNILRKEERDEWKR